MKIIYFFALTILYSLTAKANNMAVGTPTLVNPSVLNEHVYIDFDISWENSWRNSLNWDAAWIFVKYKDSSGLWQHAYLGKDASVHYVSNDNGNEAEVAPGINKVSGIDRSLGVFLYRKNEDSGSINWQNVRLRWNYGENNVVYYDTLEIRVFAIEMVFIPQGAFYLGDGSSFSYFHKGNDASQPFLVNDTVINLNVTSEGLWASGAWDNPSGILNTQYPVGYSAFYSMKYGITQGQYVAFLNTLTRLQQQERTATDIAPSITQVSDVFVMSATPAPHYRNGIRCDAQIPADLPLTFYNDLNNNGIMNEVDDGMHIACNFLSWGDGVAYTAWAGLRPMTETEYEKICRGPLAPVAGEFAWGSTSISNATVINNSGTETETTNSQANASYNNASGVQGPLRVGIFATSSSSRVAAGASYYGVMDMSGGLWERVVSLGSSAGRNFTALHGQGMLNTQGHANISGWPGENAIGSGFRGGHWRGTIHNMRISARDNASFETSLRNELFGFRAVRTAKN